jgi:glycosyltransferase involved in cell wall biosynthesis
MEMIDRRDWPLVSVCIVSYNRMQYLKETLESFRRCCTYTNLEYIIVDNGSEDMVVDYIGSLDFMDKKIMNPDNMGHGHAMNQARAVASGEYFFNLENDFQFFYRSDWLERGVLLFERDEAGEKIMKEPQNLPLGLVKFELGAKMHNYSNRPGLMPKRVYLDVGQLTQYGREYEYVSESFRNIETDYIRRFGSKYACTLSETPCAMHIGGFTTNPVYGNKGKRSYGELDELLKGKWKNGKWWLTYTYEKLIKRMKIGKAIKKYGKFEPSSH